MRKKWETIHKRKRRGVEFLEKIEKTIKVIDEIDDKELGHAVRNGLIKWWEIKAWQDKKTERK
ncbi:MAG: hypothetical protein ABIH55_01845 [Nanoarchaeota archaeon]